MITIRSRRIEARNNGKHRNSYFIFVALLVHSARLPDLLQSRSAGSDTRTHTQRKREREREREWQLAEIFIHRYRFANNANRPTGRATSSRRIVRDGLCSRWSAASRLRVAFPHQMAHLGAENLISVAIRYSLSSSVSPTLFLFIRLSIKPRRGRSSSEENLEFSTANKE